MVESQQRQTWLNLEREGARALLTQISIKSWDSHDISDAAKAVISLESWCFEQLRAELNSQISLADFAHALSKAACDSADGVALLRRLVYKFESVY